MFIFYLNKRWPSLLKMKKKCKNIVQNSKRIKIRIILLHIHHVILEMVRNKKKIKIKIKIKNYSIYSKMSKIIDIKIMIIIYIYNI